jgi:hypothetical protein
VEPPKAIEVEVVKDAPRAMPPPASEPLPIHPLAAVLLLAVDNLWNLADWAVVTWILTIPLAFASVFFPTLYLHRRKLGQSRGKALAWATFLGAIAAVPFSVAGTATGALLLAWLGINRLTAGPKSG